MTAADPLSNERPGSADWRGTKHLRGWGSGEVSSHRAMRACPTTDSTTMPHICFACH